MTAEEYYQKHRAPLGYLSLEQAQKLNTKRLLTYYKKIRLECMFSSYDHENLSTLRHIQYRQDLKNILNQREHVPQKSNKEKSK